MNNKIDDIYHDLKQLVEKTHEIIVLEKKKETSQESTDNEIIKQNVEIHIKNMKNVEKKTQCCQTTTTKATEPEKHVYVSLPPAGRKGTRTDNSILNWSRSLRFPF